VRVITALALVLALVGACKQAQDADNLPVTPGGGGGGTGGQGGIHRDAAIDARHLDGAVTGRACLVADARLLDTCASTGAGGLTVMLGSATALTASDGTFTLVTPQGSDLVWTASGSAVTTSMMPFGPTPVIPVLSQNTYQDLLDANLVSSGSGQGDVFVQVLGSGAPLAGAVASSTPPAANATLYDGTTATAWNQTATGVDGVAWIPGIAPGTATIKVTPPASGGGGGGSGNAVTITAPVGSQILTFVTASF
jgi:hypothetical protein